MTVRAWVRTVAPQDAEGDLARAYAWQARRLGEPAEFTQLGSLYPPVVEERLRLYKVVEECPSALLPAERVAAAYVTSRLNRTPHCASGLAQRLRAAELPVGALDAIEAALATRAGPVRTGQERLDAILAYAWWLTVEPGRVAEADIDRLRAAGLADLDVVDLNNLVAYYSYINRVANGLGLHTTLSEEHAFRSRPEGVIDESAAAR